MATTTLVSFNADKQIAIDTDNTIWTIDGWLDDDGDEIPINYPDDWHLVDYVTACSTIDGRKLWVIFRPDDFIHGSVRGDN